MKQWQESGKNYMIKEMKIRHLVLILMLWIYVLNIIFMFPLLGYIDELLSVFFIIYSMIKLFKNGKKNYIFIVIVFFFICFVGILGNVANSYGMVSLKNIVLSVFMFIKPYSFLLASLLYFENKPMSNSFHKAMILSAKTWIIAILIFSIPYLLNLGGSDFLRFTIGNCFPGDLAAIVFISLCIIYTQKSSWNFIYFLLSLFLVVLTNSGLVLLGMGIFFIFNIFIKKFKWNWYYVPIIVVLILSLSMNEIMDYFLNHDAPRYIMFHFGFDTMKNYFPLGSGFGTYGSYIAAKEYSFLYLKYGFESIYGLSSVSFAIGRVFLFDSYYPMIFGEFGFIGSFLFFSMLIIGGIKIFNYCRKTNKWLVFVTFFVLVIMGLGFNIQGNSGCLLFLSIPWLHAYDFSKYKEELV